MERNKAIFITKYCCYTAFTFCLSLIVGTVWSWLINNDVGTVMAFIVFFGLMYLFVDNEFQAEVEN